MKKENPRKTFLNFRNNLVMLYKNLPQEDLASVMRVRAVLDYVAAFSFMLKGQFPNALAVFRARRAYHSLRASLAASRKENLKNYACRNTGTDKKQYIGAVLSAWKEILFPIVGTVAFYNCSIY